MDSSKPSASFSSLPLEIQIYIWELAFYRNTTYTSPQYHQALEKLHLNDDPTHFSAHTNLLFSASGQAYFERDTAFWTYGDPSARSFEAPFSGSGEHAPPHIRLTTPSFAPHHISVMSGLPDLLQVCRTSRWVTLRTWKSVLAAYQLPWRPVPWRVMAGQIDEQLEKIGLAEVKDENEDPRNKVVERLDGSWYGTMVLNKWCVLPGQEGTWLDTGIRMKFGDFL